MDKRMAMYNLYKNSAGQFHRLDGPAREYDDEEGEWICGRKEWSLNGRLHRVDGPAIEWNNGHKEWFFNGSRHRLDGPAIESQSGGSQYWYIMGEQYPEKEWFEMLTEEQKLDYLFKLGDT